MLSSFLRESETISDSLKFGCVVSGMGQSSIREQNFVQCHQVRNWTNFVWEIESIEHAKKTISAPTPMELDVFQGNSHKCGKYGHTAKRVSESEPWRGVWKKHHGQCWTLSCTSSQKKFTERRMER